MASTAVAPYPNDHVTDLFKHGFEDQIDFFDQFVTFDPEDDDLLDISLGDDHSGSWSSNHEAGTYQNNDHGLYSESSGRAAISDTELLNIEGISLLSPVISTETHSSSLPPSPSTLTTKNHDIKVKTTKSTMEQSDRLLRSPIRKATQPIARRSRSTYKNLASWEAEIERILNPSDNKLQYHAQAKPLSPPPSARVSDASGSGHDHGGATSMFNKCSVATIDPLLRGYTPIGTPALDETRTPYQPSFGSLTTPVTPHNRQSSTLLSQLPSAGEFHRAPIQVSSQYSYSQESPPLWWSHAASAPLAQPSPDAFHRNPQLATKSLANQLSRELSQEPMIEAPANMPSGLMILMDGSTTLQNDGLPLGDLDFIQPQPYPLPQQHDPISSPPLFVSPVLEPSPISPLTTRRTRRSTPPASPPSPKTSPSPNLPIRKTRNTTKPTTSSKRTPTTSFSNGAGFDFVNYTPHDKRKLLNGVAPSGSSRTKARREREAKERRRRISEAALRAVIEAGGDVDGLVEQGIFL